MLPCLRVLCRGGRTAGHYNKRKRGDEHLIGAARGDQDKGEQFSRGGHKGSPSNTREVKTQVRKMRRLKSKTALLRKRQIGRQHGESKWPVDREKGNKGHVMTSLK